MKFLLYFVDRKINTMVILLGFWAVFWSFFAYRSLSEPFTLASVLFSILYVVTALSFSVLTVFELRPRDRQQIYQLIQTRCLHRLTFKLTLLIFSVSLIHALHMQHYQLVAPIATFLALAILTYNTWYTTDTFMQQHANSSAPNPQSSQYVDDK